MMNYFLLSSLFMEPKNEEKCAVSHAFFSRHFLVSQGAQFKCNIFSTIFLHWNVFHIAHKGYVIRPFCWGENLTCIARNAP